MAAIASHRTQMKPEIAKTKIKLFELFPLYVESSSHK